MICSMAVLTPESRSLGIALILLANVPYILIVGAGMSSSFLETYGLRPGQSDFPPWPIRLSR